MIFKKLNKEILPHFQIIKVTNRKKEFHSRINNINEVQVSNVPLFVICRKLFPSFVVVIKCLLAQLFPKWIPIGKNSDFDFNKAVANSKCPTGIVIARKINTGSSLRAPSSKTCTAVNRIEKIILAFTIELISIVFLNRYPLNKNSSTATVGRMMYIP